MTAPFARRTTGCTPRSARTTAQSSVTIQPTVTGAGRSGPAGINTSADATSLPRPISGMGSRSWDPQLSQPYVCIGKNTYPHVRHFPPSSAGRFVDARGPSVVNSACCGDCPSDIRLSFFRSARLCAGNNVGDDYHLRSDASCTAQAAVNVRANALLASAASLISRSTIFPTGSIASANPPAGLRETIPSSTRPAR